MTRPGRITRIRRIIETLLLAAIGLLLLRTWCVDGLPGVQRISGGSMAPTLLGQHYQVECADCGHRFTCGGEPAPPIGARIWCPNCGYSGNRLREAPLLLGDGVLIDRSAFLYRQPRRWEPVVARHPEEPGRLCVKRVAGLPGESIELRHGDVYVNGHIQRKDYLQQRAMALLVHDADHPPGQEAAPPDRWQSLEPENRWGGHGGRFAHAPAEDGSPPDWLVYRHWARRPGRQEGVVESPITDRCGYNQTRPRRHESLRPVADVMVEFRLAESWGTGPLTAELTDGRRRFDVRLWPGRGRFELRQDGRAIPAGEGTIRSPMGGSQVVVSLFDRQLLLAVDDCVLATWPFDPLERSAEPPATPVRIGAAGLGVVIDGLRVYRDVYFSRPVGIDARWAVDEPVRLAPEEFFLLGENSPIAEDSRTWPTGPGIDRRMLVGRPVLVWFPACPVELGGRKFQVPDPGRIRYIR